MITGTEQTYTSDRTDKRKAYRTGIIAGWIGKCSAILSDGCGFNALNTHSGNGIKNIKQRVQEIDAVVHIQSIAEKGSVFSYDLPL